MSVRLPVFCASISALVGLALSVGCGQSSPQPSAPSGKSSAAKATTGDYNPHDVPITEEQKKQLREQAGQFPKAVEVIKELRAATEEETKNGIPKDPFKAHQALDKADLVFQWLPEIARDSAVPKEHWEEITTTANDLRTLFEKVHQNIDNKQEPDFASVAAEIDQKIARLAEIALAKPSAKSETQP
jgi:hypothetical protein